MKTLKRLATYMDGRKALLPCSIALSGINGLLSLAPFILLWLIVRTLLTSHGNLSDTPLWDYAIAAFCIAVLNVILYFVALLLSHLAAFRIETDMRRKAMKRLLKAPLGYLDTQSTGCMRKIIDEDSSMTHTFVAHILPDLAGSVVAPIGVLILLFIVDWQLGLASMVPIIVAFAIMAKMMNPEQNHFQQMYLDSLEKMSAEAVEYVRGIPVVKVFQQTVFSFKRFHDSIISYRDLVSLYTKGWRAPMSAYIVAINAFSFVLVPVGLILIDHGGDVGIIISDLLLFVLITPVISGNIMKMMSLYENLFQANESVSRLENLIQANPLPESNHPRELKNFDIVMKDVSFRYKGASKNAVSHINLTIPKGKTFALVGASGGGKTTIARLIPRFWEVGDGEVCIGGVNIKEISSRNLMDCISFVFQSTKLFKMSILENIRYGKPDATLEEVNRAIDLSQSREIINRLPSGVDTIIGTDGTYLSGGEQQRIVLARAILKDAPIVILDEATAFADPENEHLIRQALSHLTRGKTVLMIAHRLTTVQDVDEIVVIDHGAIAEQGTHQELLDKESLYHKMWDEYQKSAAWRIG